MLGTLMTALRRAKRAWLALSDAVDWCAIWIALALPVSLVLALIWYAGRVGR